MGGRIITNTFTKGKDCGKDRFYESMMRAPSFPQRGGGKIRCDFKYCFRDLECQYCDEYKTCPPLCLCPYILDNLGDLSADAEFVAAVCSAEMCDTPQRLTLLYLREICLCA
jgi:hypothetical protein